LLTELIDVGFGESRNIRTDEYLHTYGLIIDQTYVFILWVCMLKIGKNLNKNTRGIKCFDVEYVDLLEGDDYIKRLVSNYCIVRHTPCNIKERFT